jgi:hypothetical protein
MFNKKFEEICSEDQRRLNRNTEGVIGERVRFGYCKTPFMGLVVDDNATKGIIKGVRLTNRTFMDNKPYLDTFHIELEDGRVFEVDQLAECEGAGLACDQGSFKEVI